MIFLAVANEPTMVLMLTEADCNHMRGGRTKFVDKTATKGFLFDRVVISLHKNHDEAEEILKKAGHGALLQGMPSPLPNPQDGKCASCEGVMPESLLLDSLCIACWRDRARAVRPWSQMENL